MPKKTKFGKTRLDKYYYLAKEKGYRSRASFKLLQLNKQFDFLSSARCVIDLCAAPGGWLQVARQYTPLSCDIIGVDLSPIKHIPNVHSVIGNICHAKCAKTLRSRMTVQHADVVLHDGAPNVGTNWLRDSYAQSELCVYALKLACRMLKPNGIFVTKIFRSKDYQTVLWLMNQFFERVEVTKPKASRLTSAEIYAVCFGYKAPKEIDPKLFDPNFVFKDFEESGNLKHEIAWKKGKRKRNQEGYADGDLLLYKRSSAIEFVKCSKPIAFLCEYGVVEFDEASKELEQHEATTTEIKTLCADTKLMGRYDFRQLLKWRSKMRAFMDEKEMAVDEDDDDDDVLMDQPAPAQQQNIEDLKEEELLSELDKLRKKAHRRIRTKTNKRRRKERRQLRSMENAPERETDMLDTMVTPVFSLKSVSTQDALDTLEKHGRGELDLTSQNDRMDDGEEDGESDYEDSEDERDEAIEHNLNRLYGMYKSKLHMRRKLQIDDLRKSKVQEQDNLYKAIQSEAVEEGTTSNPLLVDIQSGKTPKQIAQNWYNNNIFNILREDDDTPAPKRRKLNHQSDSDESDEEFGDSSSDESDDDMSDSEKIPEEMHDEHTRATTLAMGKKLLKKKARQEFIDGAHNRHAFHDVDNLPEWYQDDFYKHHTPQAPLTKEEVFKEKLRFKELNSKPVKAVLESKFRQKRRERRNRKFLVNKATMIAENTQLTNKDKEKELRKLYNTNKKPKRSKIYLTPKSGKKKRKPGAFFRYVDHRMKSDKRNNGK